MATILSIAQLKQQFITGAHPSQSTFWMLLDALDAQKQVTDGLASSIQGDLNSIAAAISNGYLTKTNNFADLSNFATARGNLDVYSKEEIGALLDSLGMKRPVKAATTAAVTLSGFQTIDGVSLTDGDRILVKDQVDYVANGIYIVHSGAWTRATDADVAGDLHSGDQVFVEYGAVNTANVYQLRGVISPIPGTDPLVWTGVIYSSPLWLSASGGTVAGSVAITEDLSVGGNLAVTGNVSVGTGKLLSCYDFKINSGSGILVAKSDGGHITFDATTDDLTEGSTNLYFSAARAVAALPSQTGQSGKFLTTNGSTLSWGSVVAGVSSVNSRSGAVTLSSSDVGLSNVENVALSTWTGTATITTVGTIGSGTWRGGIIATTYGGTGLSSISSAVTTFLGTPSSANLAAAVTGATGSGALVFGTSPTFTTKITSPLILGGTGTTSTLTYQATSNATAATGADHIFKVGNSGATEALRIKNDTTVIASGALQVSSSFAVGGAYGAGARFSVSPGDGSFSACAGNITTLSDGSITTAGYVQFGRYTNAARDLIGGPPTVGTVIYNTDSQQFEGYAGSSPAWAALGGGGSGVTTNALTFGTGLSGTSSTFNGSAAVTVSIDSAVVVTLSGSQTLTSKTLTSPILTTPTLGAATATSINKVAITAPASSATLTIANTGSLITSGAFAITLTATNTTSVTLPTTGTLATIGGTESLTGKTVNGLAITTTTGTLTIASGKTLTLSNSLTFTGTDNSSVAFGGGGTAALIGTDQEWSGIQTFDDSKFKLKASSLGGLTIVKVANSASNFTITLPSVTGTAVTTGDTGSVTNAMLAGSIAFSKLVGTDITTVGTIGAGTWQGGLIAGAYGGTGVANTGKTITLAGNLTTTGAFNTTFAQGASITLTLPTTADNLVGRNTVDTFTNKTFDTAGSGNSFKINGTSISAVTGTGSVVLASSPTLTTPALGSPSSGNLASCTGYTVGNLAGITTGVGTFLATPSSANLASAVTGATGSGALVFGTSPTFTTGITTPVIIGGTTTTSSLTFKATTSATATTGADHVFLVGTSAGTEALRIKNSSLILASGALQVSSSFAVGGAYGAGARFSVSPGDGSFSACAGAILTDSAGSIITASYVQLGSFGTTARDAIGGPPTVGTIIYNSDTHQFEGYSGSSPSWGPLGSGFSTPAISNFNLTTGNHWVNGDIVLADGYGFSLPMSGGLYWVGEASGASVGWEDWFGTDSIAMTAGLIHCYGGVQFENDFAIGGRFSSGSTFQVTASSGAIYACSGNFTVDSSGNVVAQGSISFQSAQVTASGGGGDGGVTAILDWAYGYCFTVTMNISVLSIIDFTNTANGKSVTVKVYDPDSIGTVWGATIKWSGGSAPSPTLGGTDIYTFTCIDSTIYGAQIPNVS